MEFIFNKSVLKHNPNSRKEGAYRLVGVSERVPSLESICDGEKYLNLVHSKKYIQKVKDASKNNAFFAYTQNNRYSYDVACIAVGLAIQASEQEAFSLARPPGHHAGKDSGNGYCLFNNIAIAVERLLEKGMKVAIVDFDAHHGNGTQKIFFRNKNVQYFSIHEENEWPFTGTKGWDNNCFNYPIPKKSGDSVLINWGDKIVDFLKEFKPDIIGVSAGFDGYLEDRVAHLNFTEKGYCKIGGRLGSLKCKTFAVLEGGYHTKMYDCAKQFLDGFNQYAFKK